MNADHSMKCDCRLMQQPREAFKIPTGRGAVDLSPLIKDYVNRFQNEWELWGVRQNADSFYQRHPS